MLVLVVLLVLLGKTCLPGGVEARVVATNNVNDHVSPAAAVAAAVAIMLQ